MGSTEIKGNFTPSLPLSLTHLYHVSRSSISWQTRETGGTLRQTSTEF